MASATIDHLSQRDFQRLAKFIEGYSGIKMPPTKKTMVEGRLRRRVRAIGATSLSEYCNFLFEENGLEQEAIGLIDAVTTNKTDFFREPDHFRFLTEQALPALLAGRSSRSSIKVWSAACSSGAEPYTLAMVFAEVARTTPGFRASILATDICTEVLAAAKAGIYPDSMAAPVALELRQRYFMRARTTPHDRVRVVPELRQMVEFGRLNLMQAPYPVDTDMHVIFCRNILIYFNKPTQQKVLESLCRHLRPGGFLFLGHSETLTGMALPLEPVATSVFRRLQVPREPTRPRTHHR